MVAFFRLLRRVQLQTPMYQGTTMEKQLFILNRSLWNINGRVPAKICIHSYRSDIYKLKSKPKLLCCHTELVNHHLRDCCSKSTTTSTIFALSSGHGKCGVAVIRISGPHTRIVLEKIVKLKQLPKSRHALLRKLLHPSTGEPLDKSLVLWFPGPESFTGEDCCELHVHGGSAVITAVLDALAQLPSFRHAEAGEFTKRAFLNGKLDLTEVEGLSDLIHAETEAQRKQALIQMEGTLGQLYMGWRKTLLKCTANVEAFIDFSEDEQIEDGVLQEARDDVTKAMGEIRAHLADNRKGERLRSGVHVAIIGEPNVGKSSLLNVLCQRPAAIVSPMAGTTRDVLETALNLGGYPIIVSDTAGLRHTGHEIEAEGVRRALQRARQADLKILVLEATRLENSLKKGESAATNIDQHLRRLGILQCDQTSDITTDRGHVIESAHHTQHDGGGLGDYIVVFNKWDLLSNPSQIRNEIVDKADVSLSPLSCITEEGMEDFLEVLHKKVKALCANPSTGNPSLTQARYRFHLEQCVTSLTAYLELCDSDVVLAAMQLHGALRNIGKLTGKITSDEILDVIFRDFCIGK